MMATERGTDCRAPYGAGRIEPGHRGRRGGTLAEGGNGTTWETALGTRYYLRLQQCLEPSTLGVLEGRAVPCFGCGLRHR